jgi:hypothetical protein
MAEEMDFLDEIAGQGAKTIKASDLSRSFLKIAQPLTPEMVEKSINGLELGDFFASATGEVFGKRLDVIVLKHDHLYNIWKPNRGGLVSIVPFDAVASGKLQVFPVQGKRNKLIDAEGNDVVESRNFYVLVVGHEELGPMILAFQGKGLGHAKVWLTKIANAKTPTGKPAAIFQNVWRIETMMDKNDQGVWYGIGKKNVTNVDFVSYICGDFTGTDGTKVPGLYPVNKVKEEFLPVYKLCEEADGTNINALPESETKALPASVDC